jgi:hypothetical protein
LPDRNRTGVPIVTLNTAHPTPDPWFATFSIIAFDPATNELERRCSPMRSPPAAVPPSLDRRGGNAGVCQPARPEGHRTAR